MGTNSSGSAITWTTRSQANQPKLELALSDVVHHIAIATTAMPTAIMVRGCTRLESCPATGIISSMATPPGISASPDSSAVYWKPSCNSRGTNCVLPNSTTPTVIITMKAVANCRPNSSRTSTIGSSRVSSHGMNRASAVADNTANVTMKPDWNQSSCWPRSSTTSRQPRNNATSTKPTQSGLMPLRQCSRRSFFSASGSATSHCTRKSDARPIGPLMKKIHCHE